MSEEQLYIQPMTGTVHTDPSCSVGTARYGTVPAEDAKEARSYVAEGRVKGCKRCFV